MHAPFSADSARPLADAHVHIRALGAWGFAEGVSSEEALLTKVAIWAAQAAPSHALHAHGVSMSLWPTRPQALSLASQGRPVVLSSPDGHAHQLNHEAWALVERALSEPGACDLWDLPRLRVREVPAGLWERVFGQATLEAQMRLGLARLQAEGLCEVHDMATSVEALRWLSQEALPLRVVSYLDDSQASLDWLRQRPQGPHPLSAQVYVAGLKLFLDGALGSAGAAFEHAYCDCQGRGQLADRAGLIEKAQEVARLGYGIAVHAIGDRACREALHLFRHIRETCGPIPILRLEHAQHLSAELIAEGVALDCVFSMQPAHLESDRALVLPRLGPERLSWAYAWSKVLAAGGRLAFGSDAPYGPLSPSLGLQAACESSPIAHEESRCLSRDQALRAYRDGVFAAAPGMVRD